MHQAKSAPDHPVHCEVIHTLTQGNPLAERRTRWVMWLTLAVMVLEIIGGWTFNSMALLADGWHMSTHAFALGLAVFTYRMAARYARDPRFSFGTWKMEILGGYTSALLLVGVAITMLVESAERLVSPLLISYNQAIGTAVLGLLVNLVSAWLLREDHHHGHSHSHSHDHDHDHRQHAHPATHTDLNLRAAYIHVLADAVTSILAIAALMGAKWWGARWLDPLTGIVGAVMVALWAKGLLRDCARVLLDAEMDLPLIARIRQTLARTDTPVQLRDLHVWRISHNRYACIVSLRIPASPAGSHPDAAAPPTPTHFRQHLASHHPELAHITVELHLPPDPDESPNPSDSPDSALPSPVQRPA